MNRSPHRLALLAFATVAALTLMATEAQAQRILYRPSPYAQPQIIPFRVNPNTYIAPNVTYRQFLYQSRIVGAAYRAYPPYAFGYNPYPPPIYNYNVYTVPYAYNSGYGYGYTPPAAYGLYSGGYNYR